MIGKLTENSQLKGTINLGGQAVQYEAGTGIDITDNVISNTITSYNDLSDKPTIPTLPTTQTLETEFTYNNTTFEQKVATYGNAIFLAINTNKIPSSFSTYTDYKITTLDNSLKPIVEVCGAIASSGVVAGVFWITTDGEVYIRLNTTNFNIFRLHTIYLKA